MYLTQITTNTTDPYEQHQLVWRLFPDQTTRPYVYVVQSTPIKTTITIRSAVPPTQPPDIEIKTKQIVHSIQQNGEYHFEITANPTKQTGHKRRRLPPHQQEQWLIDKLKNAATITITDIIKNKPIQFAKNGQEATIRTVTYQGTLQVTNPEELQRLVLQGVGPGKAFGCGMLVLRKLSATI